MDTEKEIKEENKIKRYIYTSISHCNIYIINGLC